MCHHHVDDHDWPEEREFEEDATDPAFLADDAAVEDAVDVELDREYDDRDVKTPGDD